jgi:general secretion pathway protein D
MRRLEQLAAVLATCAVILIASHAPAQSATTQSTAQSATEPVTYALNFKDVPLDTVLNYFSQTIGFEILGDGPRDARVTIMSKQQVTADEAVTMLMAALKDSGFTAVRDGRLLRIGSRDKAKKGNVPVHFGADPANIADTDEIITQVIPISNISALKLKDDLKPILASDVDLAANEGSNSIIVTDSSSSVRRLVQIIGQLDRHEATTSEIRIIQLKHAGATATAKLIDTFFKGSAETPPQQPNFFGQPQQQPNPNPKPTSERHGNTVTVAADERTNTLLVMASSDTLNMIDGIIQHLDTDAPNPAPPSEIKMYALKFAAADATAKIVNDVFKPGEGNTSPFIFLIRAAGPEEDQKVGVNAQADDRTNTVIVTGPKEMFPRIDQIIHQLDASPMVTQGFRVIHLLHADPYNAAKLLNDTFAPKPAEERSNEEFPIIFISPNSQDQQHVKGVRINITSDERTNTLLITAPTEMLDTIANVASQIDSDPSTEDTLFIYHLRNAQASHVAYTLNILFGNISAAVQNNFSNGGNQQQNQNQNQQNQQGQGGPGNSSGSNSSSSSSNESQSQRNNRNYQRGAAGVSGGIPQSINALTGEAFVVAEPDTNALLVTTASKYESQVRKMIEDLDHPVAQVLLQVLIAEVSRDDSSDIGTDFSVLNLRASGNGEKGVQTFGLPSTGLVATLLEDNVTAQIHALQTNGKLDVLSRPYLLASDNQDASITVGQQVPFITSSTIDNQSNTINTVQYEDIGVILNVTPHINPDGLVILDVAPQISSQTSQSIQLSANASSPVFQNRSANTRVDVMNGQTIVIGGLMQDQNTTTLTSVPILGSIPVVGLLFQRNQVDKTKTELLIFITPHVAPQAEALTPLTEEQNKQTKLTPNAVEPGVYDEHLRNMRLGQPAQSQPAQPVSPIDSIPLGDMPSTRE